MEQYITLPPSVHEHVYQTQQSREQAHREHAEALLSASAVELTKREPETAALLVAGNIGADSVITQIDDEIHEVKVIEQKLFGFTIGVFVIPTVTRRIIKRDLRLGKPT